MKENMDALEQGLLPKLKEKTRAYLAATTGKIQWVAAPDEIVFVMPFQALTWVQLAGAICFGLLCLAGICLLFVPGVWTSILRDEVIMRRLVFGFMFIISTGTALAFSIYATFSARERIRLSTSWLRFDRGGSWQGRTFDRLPLDIPIQIITQHDPLIDRPLLVASTGERQIPFGQRIPIEELEAFRQLLLELIRECQADLPTKEE